MAGSKKLRILFVGNSHTYYNDMPEMVRQRFTDEDGFDCEVVMIAHGGWFLAQHAEEPDVRFNIRYGHYDYVILQDHAHPFGPEEKFYDAVRTLTGWIKEAGSTPVIYTTWARKNEPEKQAQMSAAHRKIAEETGSLLAPVGEEWWHYRKDHPEIEMYREDGSHATEAGSDFAAGLIRNVIHADLIRRGMELQ